MLKRVGAELKKGSFDGNYEKIEEELIEKVAEPSDISGGQLDGVLSKKAGDLLVRLLCP